MNIITYISRPATRRIIFYIFFLAFGLFLVVYGGYDDSPGGQLLGLAMVAFGLVRLKRKKTKTPIPL